MELERDGAMEIIPVMEAATETRLTEEVIFVTDTTMETPMKRTRGRPPKADGAMTQAERSRRYREKRRPSWQDRRVVLAASTVERTEKLAAERGTSVADVIAWAVRFAVDECSISVLSHHFEPAKAAAVKAGVDVGLMVNLAMWDIPDERWNEIAEGHIRYEARKAKETQPETVGISEG